jgi:hypothetical protein
MLIKITLLITLILYAGLISQSLFYILAMSNVTKRLPANAYIQTRKLLDQNLRLSLPFVYYSCLLASIALMAFSVTNPSGILFISSIVSLVAIVVDVVLTLKGNVPVNSIINTWTESSYPENWTHYRSKWLSIYKIRQTVNIFGFVALLFGVVFGL